MVLEVEDEFNTWAAVDNRTRLFSLEKACFSDNDGGDVAISAEGSAQAI